MSKTATLLRHPAIAGPTKSPKLFVATPCYGGTMHMQHVQGVQLLLRSLDASGVKHDWYPLGNESLVTRARNRCVAEFLKGDCTDLLFVDADVGFKPKDFAPLANSGLDIVCGAYPMKRIAWEAVVAAVQRGVPAHLIEEASGLYALNPTDDTQRTGKVEIVERHGARFVEVQDAATGFLLIKRRVIEKLIEIHGKDLAYTADYWPHEGEKHYALFQDAHDPSSPVEVAKRELLAAAARGDASLMKRHAEAYRVARDSGEPARWLSEDYWFSRKCQEAGFKIHMCLDCKLTHSGTYTWKGDVSTVFEIGGEEPAAPELPVEMVEPDEGGKVA